jgi:hypothetical protein
MRALDSVEQRVIGSLIEKELSTPDGYPLTLNALVAACNQTSNRDPVSRLAPENVDGALVRLMGDLLVWRDRGARALRWKHNVEEKLGLAERPAKAVMAELLLRGAQTPGELRARTPRMHEFADLAGVETTLHALARRGFVEELPRQPGQKERRWRQLLGKGTTTAVGAARADAGEVPDVPPPPPRATSAFPAPPVVVRAATPAAEPAATPPAAGERTASPPVAADRGAAAGDDLAARVAALERRVEELAALLSRLSSEP